MTMVIKIQESQASLFLLAMLVGVPALLLTDGCNTVRNRERCAAAECPPPTRGVWFREAKVCGCLTVPQDWNREARR